MSVGGTIVFNTTLSPVPMETIDWKFNGTTDITLFDEMNNFTAPAYEGRVSLFLTTGSLELRNVTLSDTGFYHVFVKPSGGRIQDGSTTLQVFGEQLAECNGHSVSAKSCLSRV